MKQRLDAILVERNFCSSRQQAQRLIRAGAVRVNHQLIDKPGTAIDSGAEIQLKARSPYVSRGGEKLAKALDIFQISVQDRICLDGGISTGGFTDCLFQRGAAQVYGIDVGYGQVDWQLRNDPRLILWERTNLRHLTPEQLYGEADPLAKSPSEDNTRGRHADLAVVDVSFISLGKVLPALWNLLDHPREAILLVKPQFEVGRERVGKKGVVRNPADHAQAIFQVCEAASALGWQYRGLTWSPLVGPAGNIEYLLWLATTGLPFPTLTAIAIVTDNAQQDLTPTSPNHAEF
ncbi:MAG: TlyA family RNA methyltransferase [Oscillatoriales cyanobacterium RM2_1_1]|nr:TlyA family RNA methyltransferase [Oscillatoriales cyanobacterium SM2_3_0]NJO44820.1 TlyA family RNA methyltransferase [Oscillatoriales cyanobacterium RM2_1_1]